MSFVALILKHRFRSKFVSLAIDLLKKLLSKEPHHRITAREALNHPWIKKFKIEMHTSPFEDQEVGIEDENSRVHEKIKKMQDE